jgi:maleate isomerase
MSTEIDNLGWRLKIGSVIPSTNTTVEAELNSLRIPGVTIQTGRIPIKPNKIVGDKAYMDHIAAMKSGITAAIDQVLTCGPQHLIMGVALEAFWGGVEGAAKLEKDLEEHSGVGVSIGSAAVRDALNAFGAKSVAILTPHMPVGNDEIRAYMEQAGFAVPRMTGLECDSPRAIAWVTSKTIRENLIALDGDDVDALVQLGTNLAGGSVAVQLEPEIGKPVITINAACYWHSLRRCGIEDRLEGHGRLFAEH